MQSPLSEVVRRQKAGQPQGITSVCSAHPLVIEAAVVQAWESGGHVLVEATSNQVDQYGGYTGMRPADFRDLVYRIAAESGLPLERVILGGDHLGPNRWQSLTPDEAMERADALVAAYVAADFTKIHLDCSFACAGDPVPLTDDVVAERAARLIRVAEETAGPERAERIRYVIGTEVPTPGGAHETLGALVPTTPEAARTTLEQHRKAFARQGIDEVWKRVMALVVQPAVEFDHLQVVDYRRELTEELRKVLDDEPTMVYEAHSTDYQTAEALTALVEDHWAVLKVGPGLTFALREALFALAAIEDELVPAAERSRLAEVVERRMLAEPATWEGYYPGGAAEQRLARRYSYSDRMRYYWPDPEIEKAQARLLDNLSAVDIPLPLLSAHLPLQYARVRHGELAARPRDLAVDHVRDVLRDYDRASRPNQKEHV
ncbi:D-tagatose-bisphosphate aldolase, class II, non-catalytic subunit [Streptomyces violaceusniger]|uniref:D-tagatose-1,6-bisphosphate aldolase subunit GatZ n=1 Tax=Streptomyces violaceusniger (strain Tu 4113) TaxID=653045 RepID=G2P0J2_STRV4|nr:D-tagatose-bisphosphate aldolase, class II, non-catalytic subunit [Streptomyces violaceusniger]AEM85990.1 D-tagatose-bisphosphate aldolase, class II, non-catalytic subunit [Streptomyces violaceusniger Tu 4113]